MPEFIQLIPPQDALARWFEALGVLDLSHEELETTHSLNRVTAEDVITQEPLPAFHRTNVDGYAVRAADTHGASESLPVYLRIVGEVPMGDAPRFQVSLGEAALIHTGGMLPEGADAVVMLEQTQTSRMDEIEVYKAVGHGENVLFKGEDVEVGQMVVTAGVRLRPEEIGGLLALGITRVKIRPLPRVGIISSGDEVIPPHHVPKPGQVRDINSYTLASLVEKVGGTPQFLGIIPDSPDILEERLAYALRNNDMVLITAGSSASTRDFTASVIARMGKPGVLVHGVNIKPGKPTILAVCDGKPVIGMPGNPVSALVIAHLFVQPMVEFLSGLRLGRPVPSLSARLSVNIASQAGREDYIPVRVIREGNGYAAEPIFYKSNFIFTLASADGLIRIPPDATGISAGEPVEVLFLRN